MARRSGQSGVVVRKGHAWHGRYYVDVPGQIERVRRSVPIGLVAEITKPEARRKLRSMLEQQGLNSAETFIQTVRPGRTFAQQATWWQENKLVLRSLSYQERSGEYTSSRT